MKLLSSPDHYLIIEKNYFVPEQDANDPTTDNSDFDMPQDLTHSSAYYLTGQSE